MRGCWGAMRISPRLTALMERDEQRPEWCYTAAVFCLGVFFMQCVFVCVCVRVFGWEYMCYLISPESAAHPMDPVGKGGAEGCLFVSLCVCVSEKECRFSNGAIF